MAGYVELTLEQAATYNTVININGADGSPQNLANYYANSQMRKSYYSSTAYDFDVIGVKGISTTSEAGLYRIEELVDLIVDFQIKAVFVETSQSDRNIRALIEGSSARGHDLKLGGQLFSDAMGPLGTYEGTYVGMIDHNLTTIARALGADAPKRGMNNRLNV